MKRIKPANKMYSEEMETIMLKFDEYANKLDEMKYGGTPLHWASSREVIEALIDRKCDINALNFASRTALQVMINAMLGLNVLQDRFGLMRNHICNPVRFINQNT